MNSISFQDIYEWKKNHTSYLDEDLQFHIYDLLDTINEEILKKNKEIMKDRYKNNYQSKKKGKYTNRKPYSHSHPHSNNNDTGRHNDTGRTNWREERKVGLKSFIKNVDRFELELNMELNKISSKNIDIIVGSIKGKFITYLSQEFEKEILNVGEFVDLNEKINNIITLSNLDVKKVFGLEKVLESYNGYQIKLWDNIVNKICFQDNLADLYFKFIHKLLMIKHTDIIDILEENLTSKLLVIPDINKVRCNSMINLLMNFLRKNNSSIIVSFHNYNKLKNNLIEECIQVNKCGDYFLSKDNMLYQYLKLTDINNIPHQQIFFTLGKFVKYFTELNRKDKLGDLYDILLLSIYDNLKILNEILQWEPIDNTDVERRVNFMIGYLEDNTKFIKGLDTDFYRDIECELDMIRKYKTIPTSIKYKLFDCIDNFIATRNKR